MMEKRLIKSLNNVEVPRYGARDFNIPELISYPIDKVEVSSAAGVLQQISATGYPGKYTIRFVGQASNTLTQLNFYVYDEIELPQSAPEEEPDEPEAAPVAEKTEKKEKKDKRGFLKFLQEKQAVRVTRRKEEIRKAQALVPDSLKNMRVLTFDQANCWARSLGMIQKSKQLEHQLGMPLYRYYHRITGQGDGAIIAAAIAAKIPLDKLAEWWTDEWQQVHTPGVLQGIARKTVSIFKPNESGFSANAAKRALIRLFSYNNIPIRMKDIGTQLHVTVMQADLQVSTHQSDKHPDLELWVACYDSAVTKMAYNQSGRLKGEAVFLEFVEKNDVLGMAVARNNDGLQITSIGTPVRVDPENAKKLGKLGHAADKVAQRDANQFVYNRRVEQIIAKLKIKHYLRLECTPIDTIVLNSTTESALKCGVESGSGQIEFPSWFQSSIRKQIA